MKKNLFFFFLTFLFAATYSLQAQKTFSGEIQFQTKIEGTDDPNLTSSIDKMIVTVSILGNKVKTTQSDENYSVIVIWDGDKETSIFLIEINGMGKFYKKTSTEQYRDKIKLQDFNFSYENEFKEICGYKCQKVVATATNLEDDSTQEFILYVTKEIGTIKLNGSEFPGLEGFPLATMIPLPEYCDECFQTMEAIKITPKKIKDVDFLLPDDAKNIDDTPELREMFGITE